MPDALQDFRRLLSARFFFTLAVQMQAVVMGWQMYELTNDPLALGLIGLAEAVPALSLALYAGYIVDRSRPLRVYRRVIYGSLASGLVMLSSFVLRDQLSLVAQVASLYAASVLTGTARAFSQPSMFAIVPRLLPREELARSSAWMSSTMQVARIAGPAIGGLVFGFFGPVAAFSLVCGLLLLGLFSVSLIRTTVEAPALSGEKKSVSEELLSGARFVFRHPILFPALSLDMLSVLFGGVTALLPIFAKEILFVGPRELGLLRAAPAIGAAFMSFWLTRAQLKHRAGPWLLFSVAGFGISILVFGASKTYWISLVALTCSGIFDSVSMVIRNTAVQLCSPDAMRGRISAVNSMFIGSSNELGEFESGVAAKFLGTVPAVYFGGIVCLLTVGLISWRSPALRKLNLDQL